MNIDDMFSEIILTIDTREKKEDRIKHISNFFEYRGAYVEKKALTRCDYWIDGIYKDKDISLGIEYKTIEDFAGSFKDLSWKLTESYEFYKDVALFVETGKYDLIDVENGTLIRNYKLKDMEGTLRYDIFQNLLRSFERDGIYTQTFLNTFEFPRSVLNLMNYIIKPMHKGIQYKNECYEDIYRNMLMQFPGIGAAKANKIIEDFSSFHELSTYAENHLQDSIGKVNGTRLYNFCHLGLWKNDN